MLWTDNFVFFNQYWDDIQMRIKKWFVITGLYAHMLPIPALSNDYE